MQRALKTHSYQMRRRFGRAQNAELQNPYGQPGKRAGLISCQDCGAVLRDGRWQWLSLVPFGAQQSTCPACLRTRDKNPAGELRLIGKFSKRQRLELEALARHQEDEEKLDHPLNRIMKIDSDGDGMTITTTDIHLPRRIGRAIYRAHRGDLDVHYDSNNYFVRAVWNERGRSA